MGVIPGALVLSSWNKFGLVTELPKDKNTKLVFYCHNTCVAFGRPAGGPSRLQ
jgi:hypothetical protein